MILTDCQTPPKLDNGAGNVATTDSKGLTTSCVFVGSNIDAGVRSVVSEHDVIWLFEPIPEVAESLRREFSASPKAVIVIEAAVYSDDRPRVLSLYNNGLSSTLGEPSEFHKESYPNVNWKKTGERKVRCVKLGDYLPLRLTTLIIDTQGCDFEILKSIEPWLSNGRISSICSEADGLAPMHVGLPDNSADSLLGFMDQFDYTCRKIPGKLKCSPDYEFIYDGNRMQNTA